MVVEMAGGRAEHRLGPAIFVEARFAKTLIGGHVIVLKIEAVLDERRAGKGVIADAIAANPGIDEGERKNKQENEPELRLASPARTQPTRIVAVHLARYLAGGFYTDFADEIVTNHQTADCVAA